MNTYIFGSEYEVFAANANSEQEAIDMIKAILPEELKEDFYFALEGNYNKKQVIHMNSALIFDHSNQ